MIINEILETKVNGIEKYDAFRFYNSVNLDYLVTKDDNSLNIIKVLEEGTLEEVQDVLCKYILNNNFDESLCEFIKTFDWLRHF